jgi:hypothetical protein
MRTHFSRRHTVAICLGLSMSGSALFGSPIALADSSGKHSTESLARRATASNSAESARAIRELRALGPEGLRAFLEANRDEIKEALNTAHNARDSVLAALDSLCQQKDCYASQLYWYTDVEQARAAARAQRKPILSLRLLGRLDEDLSCANSRLFRIALYANAQISKLLRERFILHWQSVRAAPKLTIDFGDGRKMERTLTGNSIHYVLDSEGGVIDALPWMYGPGAFLRELIRISSIAAQLDALRSGEERNAALRRYHESRLNEIESAWTADVKRAGLRVAPSREIPKPAIPGSTPPSASIAAAAAVSKTVLVERPVLRGISDNPKLLDSIGSDNGWSLIAALQSIDATLDQSTRALMTFKDPALTGVALQTAVVALERAIAEDTVRNEYVFRARIHRWLASGAVSSDVEKLNEKIYAELFLTPSWDPWLGLRPTEAYSGIDEDGIRR